MDIEVIVTGNRALYRSLYESIDRTTKHKTATGAARAIMKVETDAKIWRTTCGQWGSYTIAINGKPVNEYNDSYLSLVVEDAIADRKWSDPISTIAKAIERISNDA